jgi:proteasome lid subunit RPN8/RPN11
MIVLPEQCRRAIEEHAEQTYPQECCGALLGQESEGRRLVSSVLPIDNVVDENAARRYLINPEGLLKAEKTARQQGVDVIGIYHSHPDHPSQASEFDREHAWPNWSYVILSVREGVARQLQSWRLRDDRSQFDEEVVG